MNISASQIAASFLRRLSKPRETDSSIVETVKTKLRQRYGEKTYNSWFQGIRLVESGPNVVILSVPTMFIKEWIATYYLDDILSIWSKESNSAVSIEITVHNDIGRPIDCRELTASASAASRTHAPLIDYSSPLDPNMSFANFVVGQSNELAFTAARRVAESAGPVEGCNPLFLYGGVGLGKTHLMHAIAWHVQQNSSGKNVAYLSAEKFMYQYITALRNKSIMDFKARFRSLDILMIDDVQFISGKASTQEEFFHTFNTLIDHQKQLVISADRSPCELEGVEERIKSRLNWGLVADVHNTSFELRVGILQKKADRLRVSIPQDVINFLSSKITSNVRELEGALNKIVAHAALTKTKVHIETVQYVLKDLIKAKQRAVTLENIQQQVAEYFGLKTSEMISKQRTKSIVHPRQIAMYVCKTLTSKSLPEIGRSFQGRDHSTVIHAIKKIEDAAKKDNKVAQDLKAIIGLLS